MQEVAVAKEVYFMDEHNHITFDQLFEWHCQIRGISRAEQLLETKRLRQTYYDLDDQSVLMSLDNNATGRNTRQQQRSEPRGGQQVFEALVQLRSSSDLSISLPRLVKGFRHTGCQDPRDHIYGLLAITNTNDSSRIVIDYSSPVLEVYLRNIDIWTDETISSYMLDRIRKSYDGHKVISSLAQFVPASSPYLDIFDLHHLREDKKVRSKVVSKLCMKCERIRGKPSYRTFAYYSTSTRQLVPQTIDQPPMRASSIAYVSLVRGAFSPEGASQGLILYTTTKLRIDDTFLKLQDSEVISNSTTLFLIVRRIGDNLCVVGSGKLFEPSTQMMRPDIWLSFQMPEVHYELNKSASLKETNTACYYMKGSVKDLECHVTFNGMAIAQILEDNEYMASFGLWNVLEFLTQHQLTDIEQDISRYLAPQPHQLNSENRKDDDEIMIEDDFDDTFNRYAPSLGRG